MRIEYTYPLIVACAKEKIDLKKGEKIEAYKLYNGAWKTFRKNSPELPLKSVPTYVLSAKYGLIPHTRKIPTYNKIIVPDGKVEDNKTQISVSDMAKKIKKQWKAPDKKVLFSGSTNYQKALEKAGFTVYNLKDFKEFPMHGTRGGSGLNLGALKWFLTDIAPKVKQYKKDMLDDIVKRSSPVLFENLERFSNQAYLDMLGKTWYEVFEGYAADPTKGTRRGKAGKKQRRRLKERDFLYDPFKKAEEIIDRAIFNNKIDMDYEYGYGTPSYAEIITILDGMHPTINKDRYKKFTKDDLIKDFDIPKNKADGSRISDNTKWELLTLINEFILEERDPEDIAVSIAILAEVSMIVEGRDLKEGEYTRIRKEVEDRYVRIISRLDKMKDTKREEIDLALKDWKKETSNISKRLNELKPLYKECRRKRYEASLRGEVISCDHIKEEIDKLQNSYPKREDYLPAEQKDGILLETYAILIDSIGRFLAGREDRLILTGVSKSFAVDYIKKNHSALPIVNPRGLMLTLGVADTDGRIGAVATVNTPTGRWDRSQRPNFDHNNVVELTRIASDGSIKGASSMLTSRIIDLLPYLRRGDPRKTQLFVTYSLDTEEGTTYAALRDKGLRPTAFIAGIAPAGARKGADAKISLSNVDKIRWEAGTAALPEDWSTLDNIKR